MKRTQGKIKDYVEPQTFDELLNFDADPARALAAYRFTDVTADLLARWLNALADLPRGRGGAWALAGARGVGKSHALAVFGALAGSERLRTQVADNLVATSARRLSDRRCKVVRVERGTRETLAGEVAAAFTREFGGDEAQWGTDLAGALKVAAARASGAMLVLIVDTAFNRPARVSRDDGAELGRMATAARDLDAFVALALDDDIAEADGANVSLAGTFQIDYLDPEHLFRVVEQHLLRKKPQAADDLHEIYLSIRTGVPGFNWSEPRFAALYPVHPQLADVASAVRLYAPAFAFLPFAARAAARVMGHPALSLVLLDEIFDGTENELRRSEDLRDAFDAYDRLAVEGISSLPVLQRHQARLVLKSLFVLSLDGRGATPSELCAALIWPDEGGSTRGSELAAEILRRFLAVAPEGLHVSEGEGDAGEPRYRFQIGASAVLDAAMDRKLAERPADSTAEFAQLSSFASARFSDWPLGAAPCDQSRAARFFVPWRGSERPGFFVGSGAEESIQPDPATPHDWEIVLLAPGADTKEIDDGDAPSPFAPLRALWRPASLSQEEISVLRRLHLLRSESEFFGKYGEAARASSVMLAAQAERVWARVHLSDAAMVIGGVARPFSERACGAQSLRVALAETLSSSFDELYPSHPQLGDAPVEADGGNLVATTYGAATDETAEGEGARELLARRLGLTSVLREPAEQEGTDASWFGEVLKAVGEDGGRVVPIEEARYVLRSAPYGMCRDLQNLVFCELVARRQVELLTTEGDVVRRRSSLVSLRWDEVIGVRRRRGAVPDAEELTEWARALTGWADLPPVANSQGRDAARAALAAWLEAWRGLKLEAAFESLPDRALTVRTSKAREEVGRLFRLAAAEVESTLAGKLRVEECLENVGEAFAGSRLELSAAAGLLKDLKAFAESNDLREKARTYLLAAEPTGVEEIEAARRELFALGLDPHGLLEGGRRERFERLWREFHARYREHYAELHDKTTCAGDGVANASKLLRGERWREFAALSRLPVVSSRPRAEAEELLRANGGGRCDYPVKQLLEERPSCACPFRLADAERFERLQADLEKLVARGLEDYRRTLSLLGNHLSSVLGELAREEAGAESSRRARALSENFAQGTLPESFEPSDVWLIERALLRVPAQTSQVRLPAWGAPTTRDQLCSRMNAWLEELPEPPALIELAR